MRNLVRTGIEGLDELIGGFPRGGLIVVSGAPGTGKTALASSFVYNGITKFGEHAVYASLIEDKRRFYEYMESFGYYFRKLEEEGRFEYLPLPTLLGGGISGCVKIILDAVESIGAKRLVIDSYTALTQAFKNSAEARTFLHTVMSRIMRQLDCTTLLVKEETKAGEKEEFGFEEFIADGIIHLKTGRLEDKLYRELTAVKLRGIEVRHPDACFTLNRGFRVLLPFKVDSHGARYEPPPDPQGAYTTGIPDLDREIGGLPDGSTVLLEIDPKLAPRGEYHCILTPLAVSYVKRGRPCLVVPSGGISPRDAKTLALKYGVSEEEYNRFVKVLEVDKIKQPRSDQEIEELVSFFGSLLESIQKEHEAPLMKIIGMDRGAQLLGEKIFSVIYQALDELRDRGGIAVWIVKPTHPWLVERLAPLMDIHLKLVRKHGALLLYGIKPRTPLYAIQPDPTGETLTPNLIPIT